MRRIVRATVMGICVLWLATTASADTLILRDGTRVSGRVIGVAARVVTFEDTSGVSHRHSADQVHALEFAAGRGRNASVEGTGIGHLAEVRADGNTLGRALKDSLRLYAIVTQFKR